MKPYVLGIALFALLVGLVIGIVTNPPMTVAEMDSLAIQEAQLYRDSADYYRVKADVYRCTAYEFAGQIQTLTSSDWHKRTLDELGDSIRVLNDLRDNVVAFPKQSGQWNLSYVVDSGEMCCDTHYVWHHYPEGDQDTAWGTWLWDCMRTYPGNEGWRELRAER